MQQRGSGQAQPQRGQREDQRDRTTGQSPGQDRSKSKQGQRDQDMQGRQGQERRGQRDQTTGQRGTQTPQRDQGQMGRQDQDRQDQMGRQDRGQPGQGAQQQPGQAGGTVNLSTEQRTRIRQTVLASGNAPRVDNVNFSLSVGAVVPRRVRVVAVPAALIEINPAWRGHHFFVVREEIVIVDDGYHVVAVLPVGSSGAAVRGGASGGVSISLSEEEIRQVQIVLKQQGFDIEVDGMLGPRTRQALIRFQQRQGLQATGQIDQRTKTALGISGQGSTTGQGGMSGQGGTQQRPSGQDNMGRQDRQGSPSTGGQGGNMQPPRADQGTQQGNPPSTSGQGGSPSGPGGQNQPAPQNNGAGTPQGGGESGGMPRGQTR
jgi:peptidoglycan hydrolase-like protein with peptidoglycan-binding domain